VVLVLSTTAPAAASRLWTVDAATGVQTVIADSPRAEWLGAPCWSADGSLVVLEQRRASLRYVAYGAARRPLSRTASANGAIWAPGCGRVAERRRRLPGTTRSGVLVRDLAVGPLARLRAYWPLEGPSLAWSPDAARVADVDDRARRDAVRVTDAATGRELARATAVRDAALVFAGAFSPDGAQVAFVDFDLAGAGRADVRVLDIATGAARTLAAVSSDRHTPWVTWSPSGDRLAVVIDGRVHIFDSEGRDLGVVAPASPRLRGRLVAGRQPPGAHERARGPAVPDLAARRRGRGRRVRAPPRLGGWPALGPAGVVARRRAARVRLPAVAAT
jgi:roadblock/LC7 domain-containing protein